MLAKSISLNERTVMQVIAQATPPRWTARLGLALARFCINAWIGAAALFVVVGIIEVTRGGFDAVTKDRLVALRFPAFYLFGGSLIGLGGIGTWLAGSGSGLPRRRRIATLSLLVVVAMLMIVDYVSIYQPLLQMVTPPGQSKAASFVTYHSASKWINLTGLLICLAASFLVDWPAPDDTSIKM